MKIMTVSLEFLYTFHVIGLKSFAVFLLKTDNGKVETNTVDARSGEQLPRALSLGPDQWANLEANGYFRTSNHT